MNQTFDTYHTYSGFYKFTEVLAVIFGFHLIVLVVFSIRPNIINPHPILAASFLLSVIISLIAFVSSLFIRVFPSRISLYVKDGELNIEMEGLSLDLQKYKLCDLIKIEFKIIGYRGMGGSKGGKDGTGNVIKVYKSTGEILERKFAINTRAQFDDLKEILICWNESGVKVKADGYNLR